MEFISNYLAHHHIKNVCYFTNSNIKKSSISECLKLSSFDNFVVVLQGSTEESNDEFGIKKINENELDGYSNYIFVFDHLEDTDYISRICNKYKPKIIVGHFSKEFQTSLVWESTKQFTQELHLAREIDDYRNEVLDWFKEDNDVELSIVFPTYNVANYLDKCIKSVTKWDAPYVEFIFVNDGSSDNSSEIIKKWAKNDKRIKLLEKENGGCASAREYGIQHSKGRYIGLVDPDDFVDETMFQKLLYRALNGMYDIAYCGYNEYYENNQQFVAVDDILGKPYCYGVVHEDAISSLIAFRKIAIWRGIYKRSLLTDNNIRFHEELKRFDDLPFKVETLACAQSVVSIPEYLYYYRMNRPGQDVSARDKRLFVHFDIFKILDEFFKSHHSFKQIQYYRQVKAQTHYWALSIIDNEFIKEYLSLAAADLQIKNDIKSWKKIFKNYYKKPEITKILKRIKSFEN